MSAVFAKEENVQLFQVVFECRGILLCLGCILDDTRRV